MTIIYKICPDALWRAAVRDGVFLGSEADLRDGFIHVSSAAQVEETAAKHFAGQSGLVLLRLDSEKLGNALKWEASRGGALFPHLYGSLDVGAVTRSDPLSLKADGRHGFPPLDD
jgi:uncharacterized protein (DUF952 family)